MLGFHRVQARWAQRRVLCNVESHWQQCENLLRIAEWRPGVHCTDSWMGHWRWLCQLSVPEDCDAMSGRATAPGASEGFVSSSSFWKFRNQKLKQSPICTKFIVRLVTRTYAVSCDLTAALVLRMHTALLWLLFLFALFLLCLQIFYLIEIKYFNYGNKESFLPSFFSMIKLFYLWLVLCLNIWFKK